MIILEDVTKYYYTPLGRHHVLRDVSLVVPLGKNIGVIGRNGAGKSTLLRLMAGVDYPNRGRIKRIGSYSWPLALAGRGVQGTMTGRENVIFAGRIHGKRRDEIDELIQRVEEFAELGDFFSMPVSTYSSGMRARLSFAIAMLFEFDCYFIDELNAVGDWRFRKLTQEYFEKKRQTATFIQVSHDLDDLHRTCQSGLLVDGGNVTYYEEVDQAIEEYHRLAEADAASAATKGERPKPRIGLPVEPGTPAKAYIRKSRTKSPAHARPRRKAVAAKPKKPRGEKLGLSPARLLAQRELSLKRRRRRRRIKDTAAT
jgi:capsular polysaccharide transport system ATP-binding protein